jgi:DNA primase
MPLPPSFLDELRARTPMPPLVGRRVKLSRSGRQWKGCCPFHNEKTASFTVYDDHFHCYGCGANGDAIAFVMRAEGATFPEAVERLAGEAGLDVPKASPAAAEAERRRLDVFGVLEAAAAAFARRLTAPEGERARAYLASRGAGQEAIRTFGLGWSGDGRGTLAADLGASEALLAQAGLLAAEDGADRPGPSRAFFFNRLMFPIRDARGRVVSFGGRVLGDGQPKYLNGPETPVFAKRRALYGIDRARIAARAGAAVIVVEGYMDVIALHQAGFHGALAPLGTALTEDHLGELWKLSPAPVLCFDGDAAGARAASRALERAIPHLAPDRSLRIVRLPGGEDPDSLMRKPDGPTLFAGFVDKADPLAVALFGAARDRTGHATPEQRAGLRTQLESMARQIRHPALAREMRAALLEEYFKACRFSKSGRTGRANPGAPRPALAEGTADSTRIQILLCLLMRHPQVLHTEEEVVATLPVPDNLRRLRQSMLDWLHDSESLDAEGLMNHVRATGCSAEAEALTNGIDSILPAGARPDAQPAQALESFWHYVGLLRRSTLAEELAAARESFEQRCDAPSQRRLIALRDAQVRLHDDMSAEAV